MDAARKKWFERLKMVAEPLVHYTLPEALESLDRDDIAKLLNEIQVYQVELEIQNEELRKTQSALEKSKDRLSKLFNLAPVGYLVLNEAAIIADANQTLMTMLDKGRQDLLHKPFAAMILPEDRPIFWSKFKAFYKNPANKDLEVRLIRTDGTFFHASLQGCFIPLDTDSEDRQIELFCLSVTDITQRVKAQSELQRSETEYRTLLANLNDAVLCVDINGHLTFMNPQAERLFKCTTKEMAGSSIRRFCPEELREEQLNLMSQARIHGTILPYETERVTYDGSRIPVEITLSLRTDEKGEPIGFNSVIRDIRERKKHEEVLRKKEQYLRAILQTTADGFWVLDARGRFVEANEAYCALSGYAREELLGMRISDLDADETPLETAARIRRIVANGSELFETRHRRKDGGIWPMEVSVTWMELDAGSFVCFGRDQSEKKQREERISLLGHMIDAAPAAITIHDTQGRFLFGNRESIALHGYETEAQFMALTLQELEVPENAAILEERFRHIEENGEARFEVAHYHRDGSTIPLEVLAKKIEWEGRPAVLSIATDISARRRAEEERQREKTILRNIFEDILAGYWDWDIPTGNEYMSPTFKRMFGYEDHEIPNRADAWQNLIFAEDLPGVLDRFERHVQSRGVAPYYNEIRYHHKNGSTVWVICAGRVIEWNESGQPVRMIGCHIDITNLKKAEAEKEALQAQLLQAQKIESVGRLAGGVAHDFNNMLSVILGHTELALEEIDPFQPLFNDLTEVRKAAERSAGLTNQLLAFARRQTIAPRVLDLNQTVGGMLKMLGRLIGEDIALEWIPGHSLWPVKIDPIQVDQVLVNLCVNARDAIPDVGKIIIETTNTVLDENYCRSNPGSAPGKYVMITVIDNGCGMDRDVLEKVFEPFFTTKETGKGTGLGLSTVYGIVNQNNGLVKLYSEVGKGTTVKVYIPAHAGKTLPIAAQTCAEEAVSGRETILLVEDEPTILAMAARMLEQLGYTVLGTATPGEALRIAGEYPGEIHLLITDVIMPEMNGRDLAKNLNSLYPRIKRLFMSGYTANVIAHHGVLDDGVNFIQKPFTKKVLAAKVRKALEGLQKNSCLFVP